MFFIYPTSLRLFIISLNTFSLSSNVSPSFLMKALIFSPTFLWVSVFWFHPWKSRFSFSSSCTIFLTVSARFGDFPFSFSRGNSMLSSLSVSCFLLCIMSFTSVTISLSFS